MIKQLFDNITEEYKSEAIANLISRSSPRPDFFLMIFLSIVMATLGLFLNSLAIIIGSMLIAPMLYPVLGMSMGLVARDYKLIGRSLVVVFKSIFIAIVAAVLVTLFFSLKGSFITPEIMLRTRVSVLDIFVSLIAGFAASFALVKPQMNESITGVAISVALVPPVAVMGIGLAKLDFGILGGASILFLTNILGIILASYFVFSAMNFYTKKTEIKKVLKNEDRKIEKEQKK